jgi:multidrug efflux pump
MTKPDHCKADQNISFKLMMKKLAQFTEIVQQDPAVAKVAAFYGSGGSYGSAFLVLKPLAERQASAREVADRLKPKLEHIAGVALYLGADRDVRVGARERNGGYQYTLLGEDTDELYEWALKVAGALKNLSLLVDIDLNQQQGRLDADLIRAGPRCGGPGDRAVAANAARRRSGPSSGNPRRS